MQAKQVFYPYSGKDDGDLGQLKHTALSVVHNWHQKRKGANKDQRAPTAGLCSSGIPFPEPWS